MVMVLSFLEAMADTVNILLANASTLLHGSGMTLKAEAIYVDPEGLPQVLTDLKPHPFVPCFVMGTRISDGRLLCMLPRELKPVGFRTRTIIEPEPIAIGDK